MPVISRFFGIVIAMYYRDHAPPHFHAIYGSMEAVIQIESGLAEGMLPKRILAMTQQWRILHREELLVAWKLAQKQERLPIIPPLE